MNGIKLLEERGFIKQCSNKEKLTSKLLSGKTAFYVGFDPTANSLHIGSLVPIMAMSFLQKMGHQPIAIIGGGTTMIGDPSGKTEMRRMMTQKQISLNGADILRQLKRYVSFGNEKGIFLNNADWLLKLNYIEFLRDIGTYFKVNEMLRSESYRQRLERQEGLSFTEFNYQLLQAYDFLVLSEKYDCILQMGGDDQWGNILAGTRLVRSINGTEVYSLTFPLLVTAKGKKMGKTESGAVWLDEEKTSVYDFYQYWINTDDRDVERFLKLFTELSLGKIIELCGVKKNVQISKEILAFEVTRLAHGKDKAVKAQETSRRLFGNSTGMIDSIPTSEIAESILKDGITISTLFHKSGLVSTKSEANRLIAQGGAYLNGIRIESYEDIININSVNKDNCLILRKGKKNYHRIIIKKGVKSHEY